VQTCGHYTIMTTGVFQLERCDKSSKLQQQLAMLCLRSEDAFVITCVANFIEVKVLYVKQDLQYEISSYWRFNV
jgi:hypothetical protein